eukprot:TRINITY_DN2767_c0_g1_i1.p1 TRINITY_DN2767_c0_g1~~TRINITY_DN2767_c0_g1_i1.p1  ORF type:complete len:175 (-),score=8.33 TRINITY_DN2767_c0_g1_i1:122-646(-)
MGLIKQNLPPDMRVGNETRDLVVDCCVEFIHLLSSEATEICDKAEKKTIGPEHVIQALKDLGFTQYVDEVEESFTEHRQEHRNRKKSKLGDLGVSQEDLLKQQQAMFAAARAAMNGEAVGGGGESQGTGVAALSAPDATAAGPSSETMPGTTGPTVANVKPEAKEEGPTGSTGS